jgi:hypothetical protein
MGGRRHEMAKRNPVAHHDVSAAEAERKELERLAAEQGDRRPRFAESRLLT